MKTPCQTEECPSICPLFNQPMVGRRKEICNGTSGLSPAKRQMYINNWLFFSDQPPTTSHQPIPEHGPGTELKKLIESVGVTMKTDCSCEAKVRQMNSWGPAGCKKNRKKIANWLVDASTRYKWNLSSNLFVNILEGVTPKLVKKQLCLILIDKAIANSLKD